MDWLWLLGLIVLLFSVLFLVSLQILDCDLATFIYSIFGKKPAEYKGKVVWITGASSGIGEAIAKELAKAGARIVLSARRTGELERVKRECLNISRLKEEDLLVLPLDVVDTESHGPCLETILKTFGKLDVLVSNAGQTQMDEFTNMDLRVDKRIFEVNVFSVINMNRLVIQHFLKNGEGQVAVVSSLAGRSPLPFSSAYSASKHAIHGYFNALRMETYGRNISVTIICPGPVDTPIFTKAMTNKPGELVTAPPLKEFGVMSPERCAYLTLISMANRMHESWQSKHPCIPIAYMEVCCPLLSKLCFSLVGSKIVEKIRKNYFLNKNK